MENVDANVPRRRGFMKNDIRIISEASHPNIKGISLKRIWTPPIIQLHDIRMVY